MNKYTSLELSKKLKENGCNINSDYYWVDDFNKEICVVQGYLAPNQKIIRLTYDILWDICIRYAKEFFSEKLISENFGNEYIGDLIVEFPAFDYYPKKIVEMLQDNKPQQEIEEYIWEHCLFNSKNMEKK